MDPLRFRVARPTNRLRLVRDFYGDGLGLTELGSFRDHDGYDGVVIGTPGKDYHLEFTQHTTGDPCPAPARDNLLVFYLPDQHSVARTASRLHARGHDPVPPENPYWEGKGLTFEDPDGWRIVIVDSSSL